MGRIHERRFENSLPDNSNLSMQFCADVTAVTLPIMRFVDALRLC
jgi:hypothetical protein